MIVVVARALVHPHKREAFIAAALEVAAPTRLERGCRSYRIHEDVEARSELVFIEEWDSRAALEAHFETPHVKRFFALLPDLLAKPAELAIHEVSRTTRGD